MLGGGRLGGREGMVSMVTLTPLLCVYADYMPNVLMTLDLSFASMCLQILECNGV